MTREELIGINAGIVKNSYPEILEFSPEALLLWYLILWIL
jgi:malate/lactate dehydrogenase